MSKVLSGYTGFFFFWKRILGWWEEKYRFRGIFGFLLKNEGDFEGIGQLIGQLEMGGVVDFSGFLAVCCF